jgi:hypothetical protein
MKEGGPDMNNIVMLRPLTTYEAISLVVSIVGFAAVVLTLWFMQHQTSSGADSLKNSAYQNCANQLFIIDKVFIEYPELYRYFYSGMDVSMGDPAYERVVAISELVLDFIDAVLIQQAALPAYWHLERWEPYFIDLFTSSPVLCRNLSLNKSWYPQRMIHLMENGERARIQKNSEQ